MTQALLAWVISQAMASRKVPTLSSFWRSPSPLFETDDDRLSFVIRLPNHPLARAGISTTDQVTGEVMRLLVAAAQGEHTRSALQDALGLKHTPHFRKAYLLPTLEGGLIEMTLPDKPNSRSQRYRLTALGQRWLETHSSGSAS